MAVVTAGTGLPNRAVRDLLGDGAVEVLVTGDEVSRPKPDPEVYRHALWQLGIGPSTRSRISRTRPTVWCGRRRGWTTVVITTEDSAGDDYAGAAAVLSGEEAAE